MSVSFRLRRVDAKPIRPVAVRTVDQPATVPIVRLPAELAVELVVSREPRTVERYADPFRRGRGSLVREGARLYWRSDGDPARRRSARQFARNRACALGAAMPALQRALSRAALRRARPRRAGRPRRRVHDRRARPRCARRWPMPGRRSVPLHRHLDRRHDRNVGSARCRRSLDQLVVVQHGGEAGEGAAWSERIARSAPAASRRSSTRCCSAGSRRAISPAPTRHWRARARSSRSFPVGYVGCCAAIRDVDLTAGARVDSRADARHAGNPRRRARRRSWVDRIAGHCRRALCRVPSRTSRAEAPGVFAHTCSSSSRSVSRVGADATTSGCRRAGRSARATSRRASSSSTPSTPSQDLITRYARA